MPRIAIIGSVLLCVGAPYAWAGGAHPKAPAPGCAGASDLRATFTARDERTRKPKGSWRVASRDEYHFYLGVYARDPRTPDGLPKGDGAVVATLDADKDAAAIIFTDRGDACFVMMTPRTIVALARASLPGAAPYAPPPPPAKVGDDDTMTF